MFIGSEQDNLLLNGCFSITTIAEGFDRYHSAILTGDEQNMKHFIEKARQVNEPLAYADFYYFTLKEEERDRFSSYLTDTEKKCLKVFYPSETAVYYPLTRMNLDFLADITARELLFSSFYFGVKPAVLWGNYQLKYPLFCQDKSILNYYLDLAKQCDVFKEET